MQRTDLANVLGAGIQMVKYTFTFNDLQVITGSGAKSITLTADPGGNAVNPANFLVGPAGVWLWSQVNVTTPFTGGSLSAMTMSVGKLTGSATLFQAARDVFTAAATFSTGYIDGATHSSYGVTVTFTPTGDTVSNTAAGVVDIYILYMSPSTPGL